MKRFGGTVANGRISGNLLSVSRGFGDLKYKNNETLEERLVSVVPDVFVHDLTEDTEFLLLACDGIWYLSSPFLFFSFPFSFFSPSFFSLIVCQFPLYSLHLLRDVLTTEDVVTFVRGRLANVRSAMQFTEDISRDLFMFVFSSSSLYSFLVLFLTKPTGSAWP